MRIGNLGDTKRKSITPLLQLTLRALHNPNVSLMIDITNNRSAQKPKNMLLPYVPQSSHSFADADE